MHANRDIIKCRLIDYIIEAIVEYEITKIPEIRLNEEKERLVNKWSLKFKNVKEFDNIVDELYDINGVVHGLSDKNSNVLRAKIGIYNEGEEQSFEKVSKTVDINSIYCRNLFKKLIWTLRNRIMDFIEIDNIFDDSILNKSLYYLDISSPEIYTYLKKGGIKTIGNLTSRDEETLMKIGGIGRKFADEIKEKLHLLGLKLKDENSNSYNTNTIVGSGINISSNPSSKAKSEDKLKLTNKDLSEQLKKRDEYICKLEQKLADYTELLNMSKGVVEKLAKSINDQREIIEELYNQNSHNEDLAKSLKNDIDKALNESVKNFV